MRPRSPVGGASAPVPFHHVRIAVPPAVCLDEMDTMFIDEHQEAYGDRIIIPIGQLRKKRAFFGRKNVKRETEGGLPSCSNSRRRVIQT